MNSPAGCFGTLILIAGIVVMLIGYQSRHYAGTGAVSSVLMVVGVIITLVGYAWTRASRNSE